MKRILIALIATAALAAPTAAFAHDGWHHHHHGLYAKLSGTGTTFSGTSATASGSIVKGTIAASGAFSVSLSTTWSSATTKTGDRGTLSCAPATASLTLAGNGSTLTGKTCAFTKTDGAVVRGFFGKGTVNGKTERLWLLQKSDGTVKGIVWVRSPETSH
jgi:hypothetical protein